MNVRRKARNKGYIYIKGNVVYWSVENMSLWKDYSSVASPYFHFKDEMFLFSLRPNGPTLRLGRILNLNSSLIVWLGIIGKGSKIIVSSKAKWNNATGSFEISRLIRMLPFTCKSSLFNMITPGDVFHAFCEVKNDALEILNLENQNQQQNDLKALFDSGIHSDVTLMVTGKEFKVHKAILSARSPVFRAMMDVDMREKATGIVTINDSDPEVFQEFLEYLYTGSLTNLNVEKVLKLYTLADKYIMDHLKEVCMKFLSNNYRGPLQ